MVDKDLLSFFFLAGSRLMYRFMVVFGIDQTFCSAGKNLHTAALITRRIEFHTRNTEHQMSCFKSKEM